MTDALRAVIEWLGDALAPVVTLIALIVVAAVAARWFDLSVEDLRSLLPPA